MRQTPAIRAFHVRAETLLHRSTLFVVASATLAVVMLLGQAALGSSSTSSNLFSGDQSTFDASIGSWVSYTTGATLATVSSPVQGGTGALSVKTNVAGPIDIWIGSGGGAASWTQARAGKRYTATAMVRGTATGRTVGALEVFYNGNGSPLASVWAQPLTASTTGWTSTYPVVGIAPADTAWVALSLVFYKTNAGEVNYVDTASLTESTVSFAAVKGPLHTTGNRIYDANGNQIVFRGIHRDGTEWSSSRSANETEIAQAKGWGANFIRVPLNEALWLNTCVASKPTNDPSYPGKIDSEANWITSRGMVALLDLHFNVTTLCGTGAAQRMADSQFSPTFWSQLAARYKGNPLVAFDLYNEPHDISDAMWLNGGTVQFGTTIFKAAGMQQLYNAVRNQGASNLVVVSGKDWANRPAGTLVTGTNIVHGFHFYTCPVSPPPSCSTANPYDSTPGFNNWTSVATKAPVMVTEFGWPDKNNGIYINNVINNAEARGWGWDAFAWDGATNGGFSLLSSLGTTYQPSPSGIPVVAGLMKN